MHSAEGGKKSEKKRQKEKIGLGGQTAGELTIHIRTSENNTRPSVSVSGFQVNITPLQTTAVTRCPQVILLLTEIKLFLTRHRRQTVDNCSLETDRRSAVSRASTASYVVSLGW